MQCCATVRGCYLLKTTEQTPWNLQLEWRSEGRGAEMFSEVTPFEDNISSILLAVVGRIVVTHLT